MSPRAGQLIVAWMDLVTALIFVGWAIDAFRDRLPGLGFIMLVAAGLMGWCSYALFMA
jgi:hypothetical protein